MSGYLRIKGYKCFEDITVPIKRLTVLAGGNSVGKSSVVQSLLLIRHVYLNGGEMTPLNDIFALNLGNSTMVLNRKVDRREGIAMNYSFFKSSISCYWEASFNAETYLTMSEPPQDYTYNKWIGAEGFHYLHAERIGPRPSYSIGMQQNNVGWQGENTIAILSSDLADTPYFNVFEKKKFPQSTILKLRNQVSEWMNFIIPNINIDQRRINEINQAYVQFNNNTPYNVGFGISYVLPIIVAGLIARAGEMLIVENPEAHLHPSGQSRIGQFLAKIAAAGTQVVVETHSEHVINGIRLASLKEEIHHEDVVVNFFSAADEAGEQPNLDSIFLNEKADLEKWPKGFFDQQQQDIAAIFKLRKAQKK